VTKIRTASPLAVLFVQDDEPIGGEEVHRCPKRQHQRPKVRDGALESWPSKPCTRQISSDIIPLTR
jgi:hypothetical protein